jgi:hypothetical protein
MLGGSRTFEDLAEDGQHSSVLFTAGRFLGADDVGQARHLNLEALSDLFARCTATKIVISPGSIREQRYVQESVIGNEGPSSGSPIEGVLVERELDRTFGTNHAQCRVELSEGGGQATKVGWIA